MVGGCFSCGNSYPKKGVKYDDWVLEEYPLKSGKVKSMPTAEKLVPVVRESRGITTRTMDSYDVKTLVDGDNKEVAHLYPYPDGLKTRWLPKNFKTEGRVAQQLFGMDKFNSGSAKAVTVTEGELDALSSFQMLGSKYPVVSLPSSSPSQKIWEGAAFKWLDSFEKIVLSIDTDGPGDRIAEKLATLFPNKVYRVPHDKYKDSNEFLQAGKAKEYQAAWWNAKKYVPDNVWNTPDQFLSIFREDSDSSYLPTGITDLDETILGLMRGHFTVFQAPEGVGKSELMRFLEYNILSDHPDVPIAICHMEETKKRSILGLCSYKLTENVTRRDLIEEGGLTDKVEEAIISLSKNENLYQFALGVDDDPMAILDKVRFFSVACGCQYVFFEPIQDLAYSRKTDDSTEGFLSELSTKLARLASELNVGIITIAHENDDGAIRDCRMIGKRASVVIRLERDKMATDEETRNTTDLLVIKNRPTGTTGFGGRLKFNTDSFTLEEKFE
jgi:twinkle protein